MLPTAMFPELLPVIAPEDDDRVVPEPSLLKGCENLCEPLITELDLGRLRSCYR